MLQILFYSYELNKKSLYFINTQFIQRRSYKRGRASGFKLLIEAPKPLINLWNSETGRLLKDYNQKT